MTKQATSCTSAQSTARTNAMRPLLRILDGLLEMALVALVVACAAALVYALGSLVP